MIRVLHVITSMSNGGAESFIMNIYRNVDHSKIRFDFLLRSHENVYADELEKYGSKIYYTASFPRHYLKNYKQVEQILKEQKYNIIHVHGNSLLYMSALEISKKMGIKCRIMHSHNTDTAKQIYKPLHYLNKLRIHSLATECFACSEDAGKWMFGSGFKIINNAIDLEKYSYNDQLRLNYRRSLNLPDDSLVIGHVGRFVDQKNHIFLLDVFSKLIKQRDNCYLVLIGNGPLEKRIKDYSKELNISDKVIFMGTRDDVNKLLNAFDVFVFPSLFEGLPFSVIEVQANGLSTVSSLAVSESIVFNDNFKRLSLEDSREKWVDEILNSSLKRQSNLNLMKAAGYDIVTEAKKLENYYISHSV